MENTYSSVYMQAMGCEFSPLLYFLKTLHVSELSKAATGGVRYSTQRYVAVIVQSTRHGSDDKNRCSTLSEPEPKIVIV